MLDLSELQTLQSEAEYRAALKAVRPFFDMEPAADTPEAAQFDALALLIEQYESVHFEILAPRALPS